MISFSNDLVLETGTGESRTIYCGLPKIDPDNYRRDYVIQRDSKKNSKEENPLEFKWNASMVLIRNLILLLNMFLFERELRTFDVPSPLLPPRKKRKKTLLPRTPLVWRR